MAKTKASKSSGGTSGTPKKTRPREKPPEPEPIEDVPYEPAEPWMSTFIEFLVEGGHVTGACKAANIGRTTAYRWRQRDETFAVAWADAEEASTERLEEEAYRRAHDGMVRNKYDKDGNLLQEELVYSDTLLIFLLKARKPEKYRERLDLRHSGQVGRPAKVDLSKLTKKELADYERITAKLEDQTQEV